MSENFTINHVGMAVPNIKEYLAKCEALYRGFSTGSEIINEIQGVREVFLSDGKVMLELLEPIDSRSAIAGFMRHHPIGGLIHVCYECDDIVKAIAELTANRAKLISGPTPDVAFTNRPIAFLFMAGQLIELVQR
jgi:methylmalonyl-CoA/ethylmalonyl-CoA epimerase